MTLKPLGRRGLRVLIFVNNLIFHASSHNRVDDLLQVNLSSAAFAILWLASSPRSVPRI